MATFKDRAGRSWTVDITVGDLKKLREQHQFVPAEMLGDTDRLARLMLDGEKLVGILGDLCEPQIEKAKLSPEDFGRGFDGPTIEVAFEALVEAVVSFSPRSKVAQKVKDNLRTIFDRADDQAIRTFDRNLSALKLSDSVTNSPAQPA